jgi:hypothetical protein
MLSRGYLVGESIDELAVLATQAQMRAKLGLTDIHVYVENFFRDILGILLDAKFKNANVDRCNTPGVDLLCDSLSYAVQVTTVRTSDKVEKTLEKYDSDYKANYKKLIILILGGKQNSYTIDQGLLNQSGFNLESDIWDISNLGHKILDLELDKLQELYDLIKKNVVKVRIELEIPNDQGEYPTNIYSHVEALVKPQLGTIKHFIDYIETLSGPLDNNVIQKYEKSFKKLVKNLSKLPRVTREFIVVMLENRDKEIEEEYGGIRINHSKITRIMKGFDVASELGLLQDYKIISIDPPEDERNCPLILFPFYHGVDGFLVDLCRFVEQDKNLDLRKAIGHLNFDGF